LQGGNRIDIEIFFAALREHHQIYKPGYFGKLKAWLAIDLNQNIAAVFELPFSVLMEFVEAANDLIEERNRELERKLKT
jgi:hypothetical protein